MNNYKKIQQKKTLNNQLNSYKKPLNQSLNNQFKTPP